MTTMLDLSADWQADRLKDVAAINLDSLSAGTDRDYEFDYLEISNVDYYGVIDPEAIERVRFEDAPSRARRVIHKDCTIISSVRPNLQAVAHVRLNRADLVCSTGFNVVQPKAHRLHPRFAYYVLISEDARQYFEATATGVGYPAVADKDFNGFRVPLPDIAEQELIATYLDASCAELDAAVAAKRKQIDSLDGVRKSLLQRAVTRGLKPEAGFIETGNLWLEQIPTGWQLVQLKRVAAVHGGLTLGKSYEGENVVEYPYLRVANVQDGHVDLTDVTTLEVPPGVAAGVMLQAGDVLMTEGGDLDKLGRGTVWEGQIEPCLHQNHVFAVRCTGHKLLPRYLAYVTASQYGRDYFEATGKRTTNLAATNATKVGAFYTPLPPLAVQAELVEHLDNELGRLRAIQEVIGKQIDTLTAYRKSLIHECVTGQRRITEADLARVQAHG